jgi:hypothetical protein
MWDRVLVIPETQTIESRGSRQVHVFRSLSYYLLPGEIKGIFANYVVVCQSNSLPCYQQPCRQVMHNWTSSSTMPVVLETCDCGRTLVLGLKLMMT